MTDDSTYKEKFANLKSWMPTIIEDIKKDLKNEHLKKDLQFIKNYLGSKNVNKVTNEDLVEAYAKAIAEDDNGEQIGEFISNRWMIKHTEIYHYFEKCLTKINPNFNEITQLTPDQATPIMEEAVKLFGAPDTYLFAYLNSVVFPQEVYDLLSKRALHELNSTKSLQKDAEEKHSLESLHKSYEQQISRLMDKYEKKLQGLERKYFVDTEGLKKQIAALQRQACPK